MDPFKPCLRPFAPPKRLWSRNRSELSTMTKVDTRTTVYDKRFYSSDRKRDRKLPRGQIISMKQVIQLARGCVNGSPNQQETVAALRQKLHQMKFWDFVDRHLLQVSKLLEDDGLPAIVNDRNSIPDDIKDFCRSIYLKWVSGNYDPDLLRGVDTRFYSRQCTRTKNYTSRMLHKQFSMSCGYVGEGDLVNGDWWPLQICAKRDGAHGETEAGIHGDSNEGAYSIVLSGGGYADGDEGNIVMYCGTSSSAGPYKITPSTQYLLTSFKTTLPVRLLRSHRLHRDNPYRPTEGIRYDGLYTVKGFTILDLSTAMYRFVLERNSGQSAICSQGPGKRPTAEEILEWDKKRALIKRNNASS